MRNLVLATAAFAVLASTPAAAAGGLVVFGDSLVDAGNVFVATGGFTPSAAQGYYQGRFNNGLNYVDYLQIKLTGGVTAPSLIGGDNYAFGGARAVGNAFGGFPVPGLPQQLAFFQAASGGVADPDKIYVINFGGNDLFGLGSGDTGGLTPTQFTGLLISNTVSAVQTLDSMGARRILVTGIPVGGAAGIAIEGLLQSSLTAIEPGLDAKLYRFSYLDFYARFNADPTSYNFPTPVNYTTPCIAAQPVVNGKINCSGYFSFDGTHFTAHVQRGIARDIIQVLGVPEPSSWAMLIAGFGMVGAVMRQRQRGIA
jgi:phospholipase/lecithinase/hemolysin